MLVLTRKLAEMDRITVLNTLAQNHNVNFYTNSASDHLIGINQHSGVDYYTDMNKIFYLSRINLNITLPSSETGLPQRIFDIMACGGFLMTNYQDEISDYFTIGKDIEVYHDLSELLEKTDYYLSHEKRTSYYCDERISASAGSSHLHTQANEDARHCKGGKTLNILVCRYGSICEPDILDAFEELGHHVTQITDEIHPLNPECIFLCLWPQILRRKMN